MTKNPESNFSLDEFDQSDDLVLNQQEHATIASNVQADSKESIHPHDYQQKIETLHQANGIKRL